MRRRERYDRVAHLTESVKEHAKEKGDGVLADKMRKIEIQMKYLRENDASPMDEENV